MKYKIVADSCCDLTADMKTWQDFEIVPTHSKKRMRATMMLFLF